MSAGNIDSVFGIGDFAALGRVSVRMLRHYDAIGLLRPARTDLATGYRYYEADQRQRLQAAGLAASGPPIAYYVADPDGQAVTVHAAVEVAPDARADDTIDVLDLPGLASAATIVHRGPMDEAFRSMDLLARWIDDNGYQPVGYAREVCLHFDADNPANWVHEFQLEVTKPRS